MRVAVVDSGLAPGQAVAGVAIAPAGEGRVVYGQAWIDRLGHGSTVGRLITEEAPDAELLAVKIFDRQPAATADQLVAAIRWALRAGARIINLSVGTPSTEQAGRLEAVCRLALERGAIVVAAGAYYPALLPSAIGVKAGAELGPADAPLDFTAPGDSPAGPGDSFAAARISGLAARMLACSPAHRLTPEGLRDSLL